MSAFDPKRTSLLRSAKGGKVDIIGDLQGSASSEAHHKKQEGYSQECDAWAQLYRG
jgi:hypothetical protein